ncbi:MAG: hypothetical protein ACYSUB_23135 [Planctomycetota bacterium]|jgi:hypothetical protein
MILKIGKGFEKSWAYLSGFDKVCTDVLEMNGKQIRECSFAKYLHNPPCSQEDPEIEVLQIVAENKGDLSFVLTNQETYLLNDRGETIERLW